jgi:hypothetical protein
VWLFWLHGADAGDACDYHLVGDWVQSTQASKGVQKRGKKGEVSQKNSQDESYNSTMDGSERSRG